MNQEITGCVIHYTDHSLILSHSASPFVTTPIFLGTFPPTTETDYIPHLSQYLAAIYSYICELTEMWFTVTQQKKINSETLLNYTFRTRFKALNNN